MPRSWQGSTRMRDGPVREVSPHLYRPGSACPLRPPAPSARQTRHQPTPNPPTHPTQKTNTKGHMQLQHLIVCLYSPNPPNTHLQKQLVHHPAGSAQRKGGRQAAARVGKDGSGAEGHQAGIDGHQPRLYGQQMCEAFDVAK